MGLVLIQGGTVITMNPHREVVQADVLIRNDRIEQIGRVATAADQVLDATGCLVIPGLIQSHVHLCQTLFRNLADDLPLLEWLKRRILPLEGAHDEDSMRLSAQLGLLELIQGGTTAILDMGSVHHSEVIFEEIERSGIRAFSGKAMMDRPGDTPPGLQETLARSIDESLRLYERWQGAAAGRIGYAFAPRFALSCTADLLREVGMLSQHHQIIIHSHASENRQEVEKVRQIYGMENIHVFEQTGCMNYHLCLAHCIWLSPVEMDTLSAYGVHVLHCPGSNLKLGSGIAPIPELLEQGISVSLGADGAPCNNNLDLFQEMRLAALIQKPRLSADALPAEKVFEMATLGGAEALGLEDHIGSIEVGKKADLAIVDLRKVHCQPMDNIYSQLVYSARNTDVTHTLVDGKILMADRKVLTLDSPAVLSRLQPVLASLLERAQLP